MQEFEQVTPEKRAEIESYAYDLLMELYAVEMDYIDDMYAHLGQRVVADVKKFTNYNANKALQNLGFPSYFTEDQIDCDPSIISGLTPDGGGSHDFFSKQSAKYTAGKVEKTIPSDWSHPYEDMSNPGVIV